MRDIPMFTTQYGVASLVLKEIPYTQSAYVHLRSSVNPAALLEECRDFCRAVGAEKVYATGEDVPGSYPLHTEIIEMKVFKNNLPKTKAKVFPVQEKTIDLWRGHYNEKMKDVPNAAWMDMNTAQEMLKKGGGYFIHENGALIGIGMVQADMLMAIASLKKGSGRDVVLALCELVTENVVSLEVASVNQPAVHLYESLGFSATARKAKWYKIF